MNSGYLYEIRRKTDDIDVELQHHQGMLRTYSEEEEEDENDIWEVPEECFENAYEQVIDDFSEDDVKKGHEVKDIQSAEKNCTTFAEGLQNTNGSSQKLCLSLSSEQISLKTFLTQQENSNNVIKQQEINKSINVGTDVTRPVTAIVNAHSTTRKTAAVSKDSGGSLTTTTTTTTTTSSSVKWKNVTVIPKERETEKTKKSLSLGIISIDNLINQKPSKCDDFHSTEVLMAKASQLRLQPLNANNISQGLKSLEKPKEPRRKFSLGSSYFGNKKYVGLKQQELPKCWPADYEMELDNFITDAASASIQSRSILEEVLIEENQYKCRKDTNPFRVEESKLQRNPFQKDSLGDNMTSPKDFKGDQIKPSILVTRPSSSALSLVNEEPFKSMSTETFETVSSSKNCIQPCNASDNNETKSSMTNKSPIVPHMIVCAICGEIFKDPRSLYCLHTFCLECIVEESFHQDSSNNQNAKITIHQFLAEEQQMQQQQSLTKSPQSESNLKVYNSPKPRKYSTTSPEPLRATNKNHDLPSTAVLQKRPSFSFKLRRTSDNSQSKIKDDLFKLSSEPLAGNFSRTLICKICQFSTEVPVGGIRQLPRNLLVLRKIDEYRFRMANEFGNSCSLCYEETYATYFCDICSFKLCTLCKEAHERQKSTANHKVRIITDCKTNKIEVKTPVNWENTFKFKCTLHAGFDIKSFCHNCLQVACADCLILQHKGHKVEVIEKAIKYYTPILKDSTEQTRLICKSAEHSLDKLNASSLSINRKCDELRAEVEEFMEKYAEAVEAHRKTLIQEVQRSRETKINMIGEQQWELENRTLEGQMAIRFSQELMDVASDVEILSFIKILLKRFEYCQQLKAPCDAKIINTPNFLSKIQAPLAKDSHDIPMYGIITIQTVEPSLCTLQWDGFSQLRLNKKVELTLISRDADGLPMCHGGLKIQTHVKYKDLNSKCLRMEVTDNSDGTYSIGFTPDSEGTILLMITINEKHIKGSPFSFLARPVRPHTGVYHCCTFCSSKGNKLATCSCEGNMPGYSGCGHGHSGHPGRRHWSCCGEVSRNSECYFANRSLNPK